MSSSGVSGVRIVNMIYGPCCWPGGKPGHSTGQDTPHFTPTMPSQALCNAVKPSQALSPFSFCISFSFKCANSSLRVIEERVTDVKTQILNPCKTRLKIQTQFYCHWHWTFWKQKKLDESFFFSFWHSPYLVFVCPTNHFITDLFFPPTASGVQHRGIGLPKPAVWPRVKPGKDKPR